MDNRNVRNTVLNMLIQTLEKGEFSHHVLRPVLEDLSIRDSDRAFIMRLYTGTLEKLVWLDYYLDHYSSVPVRKMKPVIRNLLRMSLYQMRFMDSVPDHACIDEAVKMVRKRGFSNLTGFVNGILRTISREQEPLAVPDHVRWCVPAWIYCLVTGQYGKEAGEAFFSEMQKIPEETVIRMSLLHRTPEQITESLEREGCTVRKLSAARGAYALSGFSSLTSLEAFRRGWIVMQDTSSQMAVEHAASFMKAPEQILDVCAAPGGKSLYYAELFPDAQVIARDLTERKIELIRENIQRLGAGNVSAQVFDARMPDETMREAADVVIADLPCSGLGVIRRKPDILYRLQESDIASLCSLQREILAAVSTFIKEAGILVYSTCTIDRAENQDNAAWFCETYPYELLREEQFLPGQDDCDGFYLAVFRKLRSPAAKEI